MGNKKENEKIIFIIRFMFMGLISCFVKTKEEKFWCWFCKNSQLIYWNSQTPAAQPTPETFSGSNSFSSPKKSSNEIKFKEGKYAGSGTDFTMLFSFGSVSMNKGYTTLAMGTYRISGNQLVITFTYEAGGGNELRGKTYSYTISDSQNFSGMGEHLTYVGAY